MNTQTLKTPPTLADLTLRFVNRSIDAAVIEAESSALGEIEPHEVAVGFRTDPRLAWNEGLAAFDRRVDRKAIQPPSEWATIVVRHEPAASQPFALGGYPQRVRELTTLVQTRDLAKLLPGGENRPAAAGVAAWARKQMDRKDAVHGLLAVAVLRAAEALDQAEALLAGLREQMPEELRTTFGNEEAALLWQQGETDRAAALWDLLPETAAVLFNRGMAALFLGNSVKARMNLKKAIGLIPEADGWHHLAGLYLALAEMRSV